jgi:hypothetical protein
MVSDFFLYLCSNGTDFKVLSKEVEIEWTLNCRRAHRQF